MRDPEKQAEIDSARGAPTELEIAMQKLDAAVDAAIGQPPTTTLTGDAQAAWLEFQVAARDVEQHQAAGPALMERYRQALAKLSQVAARGG